MKDKIEQKIAEFEKQKDQLAELSRIEGMDVIEMAHSIVFVDRQISLLKWVLTLI